MLDIQKQIAYWQNSAVEDWQVAQDLLDQRKVRHGLFFAHLSLEKLLKAVVCHHTDLMQAPPPIGAAKQYFQRAAEVYQWLIQQLSNLSDNTSTL